MLLTLFVGVLSGPPAEAATVQSFLRNREGRKQFNNKSYLSAHREFMKALESEPLNPQVQLNLGLTYEASEDFAKAEQAYRGVLRLVPEGSEERFQAMFNLGNALGKQKKIDEALAMYQACLDMKPDSVEVKTNIELLWQGGGGGGKGDKEKDKDNKDGKDNDQRRKDNETGDPEKKPDPQPKPSPDLSKEDIKRILDEIKNQEQGIRAQEYEKNAKEAPKNKDW